MRDFVASIAKKHHKVNIFRVKYSAPLLLSIFFFVINALSALAVAQIGPYPAETLQQVNRGPYLQTLTEDSVIVRWRTQLATDSVVRFGLSDSALTSTAADAEITTEHTVELTGLSPLTGYFYSIGDSGETFAGDASFSFTTAPVPGTSVPTRFWVIGDSGTANANARAVRDRYKDYAAASKPADFMLMLGDNAYNDGTDDEYQAAVFETYPVLLRQLPVWPTLGNHDGHSADSATQTGPYYDIFDLPTGGEAGGWPSGTEAYYSYDYGDIHFIVLDSYDTDRSAGGVMMTWLEADLISNDKPWIIAFWHHPPYTKGSHNSDTEGALIDMRQNALPLLEAYGVDLVLSGHSHSYERSMLLDGHYGISTSLDVPTMILDVGDGNVAGFGAYEKPPVIAAQNEGAVYAVAGSSGKTSGGTLDHPVMYVSLNVLGSMVLDVDGDRLDAVFIDYLGAIRDEFTILKTADITAPQLTKVSPEDASHVLVEFNERLDVATAETALNYSIGGLSISAAELLAGGTTVRLTVSTMIAGAYYLLTVNNVQDDSDNSIAPNSQAGFYFILPNVMNFQDGVSPSGAYTGNLDASLLSGLPTTPQGVADSLEVDGSSAKHTVIAWDISSLPATAVIASASIHMTVFDTSSGSFGCNAMLSPWTESEVTWNDASSGVPWATAGATGSADRASDPLCSFAAPSLGALTIDLNTDGITQVQNWADGADNYGFMLGNPTNSDGVDFRSSEYSTAAERPRLEVTYYFPIPAPNTPTGLGATAVSPTQIDLDWTDNSVNETGFKIERSPNGSSNWTNIASPGPSVITYSDTGLSPDTTYHYRVYAENVGGNSGYSNLANDTTLPIPTYTIGGNVSGLSGTGLVLQNNAADDLPISVDGGFTFSSALVNGSGYAVTVLTQPSNPNQTCTVSNGSGTLAGADITDVAVTCATHCNTNAVADVTENSSAVFEACETLVLGPNFISADGASVTVSSGLSIDFTAGFLVEPGATLDANVCGQSLCETSTSPMPNGCHSCVDQICGIDPACCDTGFNQACLNKVDTVCGLVCE